MANPIQDGGYAFPQALGAGDNSGAYVGCEGMSLRDYFAARVLAACATAWGSEGLTWDQVADSCYVAADAMLKAREAQR